MGLLGRLFGKKKQGETPEQPVSAPSAPPSAAPSPTPPAPESRPAAAVPVLQVLFSQSPFIEPASLTEALRALHPSLADGVVELDETALSGGTPTGRVTWGPHVVNLKGSDHPIPAEMLERSVGPAHYRPDQKDQARAHRGYITLFYGGSDESPWNQYSALALVAALLTRQGGTTVVNPNARGSVPASVFDRLFAPGDAMEKMQAIPPLLLYCGFLKYKLPDNRVWMRTAGNHVVGLPDLAILTEGHEQGERVFHLLNALIGQFRTVGREHVPGETIQAGPNLLLHLRAPTADEPFLASAGKMLVLQPVTQKPLTSVFAQ